MAKRKSQFVLDRIKDKTTLAEICRRHDLTPSEFKEWGKETQRAMVNALRNRPRFTKEQFESRLKELRTKAGVLLLEDVVLKMSNHLRGLGDKSEA